MESKMINSTFEKFNKHVAYNDEWIPHVMRHFKMASIGSTIIGQGFMALFSCGAGNYSFMPRMLLWSKEYDNPSFQEAHVFVLNKHHPESIIFYENNWNAFKKIIIEIVDEELNKITAHSLSSLRIQLKSR